MSETAAAPQIEAAPRKTPRRVTPQDVARSLWRAVRVILVAYFIVLLLLVYLENSLVFLPHPYPHGRWNAERFGAEDVELISADGTRLHGWYAEHPNPRAHVLFLHGNGGNLTYRAELLRDLREKLQVSALILDYRGYGKSEGSPTEEGILADARAARRWLAKEAGIAESDIVLHGRSLGGGVAVDLAAKDGARGLILESTFTSLPDVAAVHYPWVPTHLLMRNRLNSLAKIGDYDGPLLQSHGTADETIPIYLGRRLFEAAPGQKQFVAVEGEGHNRRRVAGSKYYEQLDRFLDDLPEGNASR